MSLSRRSITGFCCLIGLAAISFGCQSTQSISLSSQGIRPPDAAINIKEARFYAAIDGLSFDTGLVVIEPDSGISNYKLANALHEQGLEAYSRNHVIDALALFNQAVHAAPDLAIAYNSLGQALHAEGEADYALAAYRTALSLDANLIEAKYNIAIHLGMTGKRVKAIEMMIKVIEANPNNAVAHERIAIWSYYLGNYKSSWQHTHAAEALGHDLPPQFIALLKKQSSE